PRLGRPFVEGKPGNYTSQYFDEPNGPLYPFGYGLSYTQFSLSPPRLSTEVLSRGQSLDVSVTLKNIGKHDGATVVQLYIHDLAASVVRPVKELKGFRKVWLKAGEEQQVRFSVGENELKFVDAQLRQVAETGMFEVQVGLDSQHVQTQRFELR
ncbi:MAG TPA: beta-glucosidase, partial [Pseudomonas sp.]|nr:beta-glucosidase [Pseudomonas sp.]